MWGYVFLVLMVVSTTEATYWDCRHPKLSCINGGTCNAVTKQCECKSENAGYNCGIVTADVDKNECNTANPCKNGGTCMDGTAGGTSPVCSCTPDYVGAKCKIKLWDVVCHKDKMEVTLKPTFNPAGGVYDPNKMTCKPTDSLNVFTKTVVYTGDNECDAITSTKVDNKETWEQKFLVRENADYLSDADFIVIFRCVEGEIVVTSSVDTVSFTDQSFKSTVKDGTIGDVSLNAVPPDLTQPIGTPIEFTVTGNADLAKIKVDKITVKGKTPITIVEDGCPVANKKIFIHTAPALDSNNALIVKTTLFVVMFLDTNNIEWEFTVKTCMAEDVAPCKALQCGAKRRRRSAEELTDNSTHTYNYKINVVESIQNIGSKQNAGSQSECVNVDKMTAAVVAMAVACFVLLVICLVFIVRTLSSRRNVDGSKQNLYENGPYQIPRMVVTKQ